MQIIKFHPGETMVFNAVLPFSIYDVKAAVLSFRGEDDEVVFEAAATGVKSEDVYVTDENGNVVYVKDEEGNDTEEKQVEQYKTRVGYTMNQSESLLFQEKTKYTLQVNVYGHNGSRIASKEIPVKTETQQLPVTDLFEDQPVYTSGISLPSGPISNEEIDGLF